MTQINTGIRGILSSPTVYNTFQTLMGMDGLARRVATELVGASAGTRVLDLGSGTSRILEFLPHGVDYHGYDVDETYVAAARARYGERGQFHAYPLDEAEAAANEPFDVCLMIGVIHHLGEDLARDVLRIVRVALRGGGRLITTDPCFSDDQHPLARLLVSWDRGQNVRDRDGYVALASGIFAEVDAELEHQRWIPYTTCVMQCRGMPEERAGQAA